MNPSLIPLIIAIPLSAYLLYTGGKAQPKSQDLAKLFGAGFLSSFGIMYWLIPELPWIKLQYGLMAGVLGGALAMIRVPLDIQYTARRRAEQEKKRQSGQGKEN